MNSGKSGTSVSENPAPAAAEQLSVLAVGEVSQWRSSGRGLPWNSRIHFQDFRDLDAGLLARLAPDIVLSPLMCQSFDCLDLAQLLHRAGYRGRYRVMVSDLPNPEIVLNEARTLCPGLNIEFIDGQWDMHHILN